MKLKRIVALPFCVLLDICTLGNFGGRLFTQQLLDAERKERWMRAKARTRFERECDALRNLLDELDRQIEERGRGK